MNKIISLVFIISLSGCATSYHGQNFFYSDGYRDSQLDENVFRVTFYGNGYTSPDRVSDFVLLRSAELALNEGFQFFALVNPQDYASVSSYTTPSSTNTTFSATQSGPNIYGTASSTTSGGQSYFISKPSRSAIAVCFDVKPEGIFSFSSRYVYDSLTSRYGIKKKL